MNNNARIALGVVAGLAVLIGLYFILRSAGTPAPQEQANTNTQPAVATNENANAPANANTAARTRKFSSETERQLYNEARNKYANRVEFTDCHGSVGRVGVGTLVMDQGTQFMIDNNDESSHKFVVKSQTFTVKPYYFAVVTAKDLGTYPIMCDGIEGAQLTVQK